MIDKQPTNVMVFGATSGIAESILRIYAARGCHLFLVARNAEKLMPIVADLKIRGAGAVHTLIADLDDTTHHANHFTYAQKYFPHIHLVVIAQGVLLPQENLDKSPDQCVTHFHTNATSVISLLMRSANIMEAQGSGNIAVFGSVAGDVGGRAKMTIYGAAKSAVDKVAMGLSARFLGSPIHITLIKPGPIETNMTKGMALPLMASLSTTAPIIVQAIDAGKRLVYVPFFWRFIMGILQHLPFTLLVKLKV